MKSYMLLPFFLLLLMFMCSDAAKILVVIPLFAKSHHYTIQPIIRELAERGHDITFYTPMPLGKNYTNVKQFEIHLPLEKMFSTVGFEEIRKLGKIPWFNLISFWPMGLGIVNQTLEHPEIRKLIHSNEKFDLILLETFFGQESLIAFGHKFKAPVIALASFSSYILIDEFTGNPFGTSYIPGFELPYTNKMTFFQRFHNTVRNTLIMLMSYSFYLPSQESLMRKHFNYPGSETIPPMVDMLQNTSLVIVNSQISIDYPRAWVPNVIGVAGLHISPDRKPLPKDLKDFMDNSKNGILYVSFGSVVPSEKMPDDMREAFIKAFSKLKQNVLWKISLDSIPGLPKNVKTSKWLPQQDVLAHPNCLAFVTHGGLLSQQEAVYFSVPLVGIPFFGDQYMNIERAAAAGFAISLDQYNLTETSLTWAINEVLNNPKYRENIKTQSKIFRDNPQPPIEKAMYWVEYILKYNGAPHLRSEGRKLSWFQYLLLDVIGFIALILISVLFIVYLVIKFIVSLCRSKKKPEVKSSKKKN
ncbi:UDP-glycosyltransferase UGT5-like [Lycorma delicatula]|uniref:UDP-glycosyltransferase UGT5-like n=1 Tax=Lycorma delicatula TaxID=130591 RepID=UPI003F5165DC